MQIVMGPGQVGKSTLVGQFTEGISVPFDFSLRMVSIVLTLRGYQTNGSRCVCGWIFILSKNIS